MQSVICTQTKTNSNKYKLPARNVVMQLTWTSCCLIMQHCRSCEIRTPSCPHTRYSQVITVQSRYRLNILLNLKTSGTSVKIWIRGMFSKKRSLFYFDKIPLLIFIILLVFLKVVPLDAIHLSQRSCQFSKKCWKLFFDMFFRIALAAFMIVSDDVKCFTLKCLFKLGNMKKSFGLDLDYSEDEGHTSYWFLWDIQQQHLRCIIVVQHPACYTEIWSFACDTGFQNCQYILVTIVCGGTWW